jgi:opacity protein-like surface antigen
MKTCIGVMGACALLALTAVAQEVPSYEVSLGYDFARFNSATNVPAFSANGGSGQFAYNFNRWFSGVLDLGAVHNGNIHNIELDSTIATYLAGPRVTVRKWSRVTPYFQTLFGGAYATTSTAAPASMLLATDGVEIPAGANLRVTRQENNFAMTAGGGLDIKISRHLSFRPIQVEYFMTRLHNLRTPDDNTQNNLRYSAGFTFMFGGENPGPAPAPPISTKTCPDGSTVRADALCPKHDLTVSLSATPNTVCPGDMVQMNPSITTTGDKNQLHVQWSVNGHAISQAPSFIFESAGREPGTYNVGLSVNGTDFNPAEANTTVTVREYLPPTGTAQANPPRIAVGEASTLSANFQGQCSGSIQPATFTASEGSVQGDQFDCTGVQFDPSDNTEQQKTITITAHASDNRSVGTATTPVTCIRKATIAAIRLPDVMFPNNNSRVNNCGKRILLEQLRGYLEKDPTGTVVLVGHSSQDETAAKLDLQRAMNSGAVITAGTGICLATPPSQVFVSATGGDQNGVGFESGLCEPSVGANASPARRVEVWFVPTGGQLPSSLTKYEKATALPLSSLGCPK